MSTSPGPRAPLELAAVGARRRSRERALGLCYEAEAKGESPAAVLAELPVKPEAYAATLVEGVSRRLPEIDALIGAHAHDWGLERLAAIDRQVLRISVFELLERTEVPVAVVIDEAVELAKQYSREESGSFVNGVLAAVAAAVRPAVARVSTYSDSGVDYGTLDAAKRLALTAARATTAGLAAARGAHLDESFFGEPAALLELGALRLGFVLECLGTKSMVAAAYESLTGLDRYSAIGYDTVAAAVNDCCCVGALPVVVNAYFATGAAEFYRGSRHASLVEGFAGGCIASGASWGGGESPTLSGLVDPAEIDLAAAAVGIVPDGVEPLAPHRLAAGDEIVLIASSGLHANGASLVRRVAANEEAGLLSTLPSGRSLGEAVLDESIIYVPLLDACFRAGLAVHYASHITGHGLRKLMRAERALTYRVARLPAVPEVLAYLVERADLDPREAYATFNMGAGFALFCAPGVGVEVVALAEGLGLSALLAGEVEAGERRVVLEEPGVVYDSGELELH